MARRVKICGITRLEDARYASAVGADYLGFIQKPDDLRRIDPAVAKEIIEWVVGPMSVGVFQDQPADKIIAACKDVGFPMAQLDGHESPSVCRRVHESGIPIVKTIQMQHDTSVEQMRSFLLPYADVVELFRLDISRTTLPDATIDSPGEIPNWRLIRELASEFRVVLSGKVTLSNVEKVIESIRPWGLDLLSSLEETPGVKDFDKLSSFFDAWPALATDPA